MGNELGLEVLRGPAYFGMRGEDWVDFMRFGRVFNADVSVGDQSVV